MKTLKTISAISVTLVLTALFTAFAAGTIKKDGVTVLPTVRHQVTICMSTEIPLCNLYLVEILNAEGKLAAPPQVYVPGITKYVFQERGPFTGIRYAVLVVAPYRDHFQCELELFTQPSVNAGLFQPGTTYLYDLYPLFQQQRD